MELDSPTNWALKGSRVTNKAPSPPIVFSAKLDNPILKVEVFARTPNHWWKAGKIEIHTLEGSVLINKPIKIGKTLISVPRIGFFKAVIFPVPWLPIYTRFTLKGFIKELTEAQWTEVRNL